MFPPVSLLGTLCPSLLPIPVNMILRRTSLLPGSRATCQSNFTGLLDALETLNAGEQEDATFCQLQPANSRTGGAYGLSDPG